jgi:putative aldouronate transport system permease protein
MRNIIFSNEKKNIKTGNNGFLTIVKKDFKRNYNLYIMLLPIILFYLIFNYKPMYGAVIAFKNYIPSKGIWGSPWVGFRYFNDFFGSYYFFRIFKNTLWISLNNLIFGFPTPIIFALLINEIKGGGFKRTVQTITYLPHFISLVVICGMIKSFTMDTGVINYIIGIFGGTKQTMLNIPGLFVPLYIISEIWQSVGWDSIIYIAAIAAIDPTLYEAATIDGAGRWKQTFHVTVPSILPTITIMLILRIGNMLNVGFEKIILLYNPGIYDTADVISTFVYRKGIQELNWSYSTAVGLFNSVMNFLLLVTANWISGKVNDSGLW